MSRTDTTRLDKDQTLVWQAGDPATLEVLQGRVWVTASNCLDDHFIDAGIRLALPAHSRVVISGECTAVVRIDRSPMPFASVLRRWPASLHRSGLRSQPATLA